MKIPKLELRELKVNVANPHFDRRVKAGWRKIDAFKAGTRFIIDFYGNADGVLEGLPCSVEFTKSGTYITNGEVVKLLYGSSQVVEPKTFQDLETQYKVNGTDTINQLLADGTVTIQQVAAAQEKVIQEKVIDQRDMEEVKKELKEI